MPFHFRQFDIEQDACAMKVGTDGVLLGALAEIKAEGPAMRVLDIGTGTGLIALMVAQRLAASGFDDFFIDAIEIDHDAANQARGNFEASPWSKKLKVHHCALADFNTTDAYNLIVCNPPFYNATLKPDDEARATARHKDALPMSQIMQFAAAHLLPSGQLWLIYPTELNDETMTEATIARLCPWSLISVVTRHGKAPKRQVAGFGKSFSEIRTSTLALRDTTGSYSEEYVSLTKEFYLSLR